MNQDIYNDFRWMSGDEGDRTPDLGVANAALSHLSYIPTDHEVGRFRVQRSGLKKPYSAYQRDCVFIWL